MTVAFPSGPVSAEKNAYDQVYFVKANGQVHVGDRSVVVEDVAELAPVARDYPQLLDGGIVYGEALVGFDVGTPLSYETYGEVFYDGTEPLFHDKVTGDWFFPQDEPLRALAVWAVDSVAVFARDDRYGWMLVLFPTDPHDYPAELTGTMKHEYWCKTDRFEAIAVCVERKHCWEVNPDGSLGGTACDKRKWYFPCGIGGSTSEAPEDGDPKTLCNL